MAEITVEKTLDAARAVIEDDKTVWRYNESLFILYSLKGLEAELHTYSEAI